MGFKRPVYSGLLGRLMTDQEQEAQEKYIAERTAKLLAETRKGAQ